jgi:hypothetical protein
MWVLNAHSYKKLIANIYTNVYKSIVYCLLSHNVIRCVRVVRCPISFSVRCV